LAALQRTNEYRDAGVLIYEPRFLDVERTIDELKTSGSRTEDETVASIAESCAGELKSYRQILADLHDVSGMERAPAQEKLLNEMLALRMSTGLAINLCVSDVRSYIR
jgi:hypothetical protein